MNFPLSNKRVWVAGHRGMVGRAIVKRLSKEDCEIITISRQNLDLTNQDDVTYWFKNEKPEVVILAAAKVGGIYANSNQPAEFLRDNIMIQSNVIHAAFENNVHKLLFLGSSCIYPKMAPQPIVENALLSGPLEQTNEAYAIAKIAGIKMCQTYRQQYGVDFISAQPCNLYGPGDNYDLENSHVLPALIRKTHEFKRNPKGAIKIWGTGNPMREFLHVDDLADALLFLLRNYSGPVPVNIGSGKEVSINELAKTIAQVVGCDPVFTHDTSKPDGTKRKLLNSHFLHNLGWNATRSLRCGLSETYRDLCNNKPIWF